jgi:hypothetical protein
MIADHFTPLAVGLVRGEDNRPGFVELRYQLKEGVRAFIAERKIPDLVHDQKLELSQPLDIWLFAVSRG